MYSHINREKTSPRVDTVRLARDVRYYRTCHKLLTDIHRSMALGSITRQQHDTLCGQVRTGDAEGAEKGFLKLLGVAR